MVCAHVGALAMGLRLADPDAVARRSVGLDVPDHHHDLEPIRSLHYDPWQPHLLRCQPVVPRERADLDLLYAARCAGSLRYRLVQLGRKSLLVTTLDDRGSE